MKPVRIESRRLLLRSLRMQDARALTQAVQASAESLRPYLFWADSSYDLEMARDFVRFTREGRERDRELHLGVFDKKDDAFLGMMGLMRLGDPVVGYEIGYWIRSDRQGEGLCTEAFRSIARYAFEDLGARRLWLNCDVKNMASRRIAEKLGMRREGRVKAMLVDPAGNERDHYLYGLLKREFEA